MSRITIPCIFLLLITVMEVGAQPAGPASYSSSSLLAIRSAPKITTQGKVHLYLAPAAKAGEAKEGQIMTKIKNSVRRLDFQSIKRKRSKKAIRLIRHEVESNYLRHFSGLADFHSLFETGKYNDLTAAALVSILMQELDIPHQLYLNRHNFRIELIDGTSIALDTWGHQRKAPVSRNEEQAGLVGVLNALKIPSDAPFYQKTLAAYQTASEKKILTSAELTGMLYYQQGLEFYTKKQLTAALTALDRGRTLSKDPRLDLVRYAILYQEAAAARDSLGVEPLFELFQLHPSPELSHELIRRFATLADYHLLKREDQTPFDELYTSYQGMFSDDIALLQQVKEIYFIELARFYARKFNPQQVLSCLDSLTIYRPKDRKVEEIMTPLLMQSLLKQEEPGEGLALIDEYRREYSFLRNHILVKDMELYFYAENTRRAFESDQREKGQKYLDDFDRLLAVTGSTPRCNMWITSAYASAASYFFRQADYNNARWFTQRALALIPGDPYFLHRVELLMNY